MRNVLQSRKKRRTNSAYRFFLVLTLAATACLFVALRWEWKFSLLAAYALSINFVTLVAYAYDKTAAIRGYRRVPENVLHLQAAVGGSPAALAGQVAFHHKTIKTSFRRRFWGIVIVQAVVVFAYWLGTRG